MQANIHRGQLNAEGRKFAVVVSRWNDLLTERLLAGALEALSGVGVAADAVDVFKVPGAFELPLACQKAAETAKYDAVIALGVVIRGETPHFDLVAGESAKGISNAALRTGVPITFGVVTTDTVEQAMNRCGLKSGNKGAEAALSAIEMISVCQAIDDQAVGREKVFPHVV